MSRVPIDRFQRVGDRDRWGLGECGDALDTQRRNAPVVLKRLPPLPPDEHHRLDAVARSLEPLRHGSIVPVLGHGFDGDAPFLVLEPAEGLSLRAWADDHRRRLAWPDLAEVHALIDAVCAAVAVAHRMRALAGAPVLHGMLSPESVLLSRAADAASWDVAVMDFGLAALPGVGWSPDPADPLSDPRSPEQLADRDAISAAGDVFALGVLLASMLVPFALPVKPRCWAHTVEAHPETVRSLLVSMRPDVPPPVYAELVKALSRDASSRHPDADRLRTALRRVSWEPLTELPPPPRFVEPAEAPPRERADEHSKPLMRLPSALLADLGPSPMNLRASVPTQKMFNGALTPAPREATNTAVAVDPAVHEEGDARSFAGPPQVTTVDALVAFRELAREEAYEGTDQRALPPGEEAADDELPDEPTGSVPLVHGPELTDDVLMPEDDLLAAREEAEPAVAGADLFRDELEEEARRAGERAFPREPTRALSPESFDPRPSGGLLVSGVKLQSLVLTAPRKPPERHEGTRVNLAAPEPSEDLEETGTSPAFDRPSRASGEYDAPAALPPETPSDPWAEGAVPEALMRPSLAPPEPDWAAVQRPATMAPPPSPNPWMDTPATVQMTMPVAMGAAERAPAVAPKPSSLRVALLVATLVVTMAFALGVMAGR